MNLLEELYVSFFFFFVFSELCSYNLKLGCGCPFIMVVLLFYLFDQMVELVLKCWATVVICLLISLPLIKLMFLQLIFVLVIKKFISTETKNKVIFSAILFLKLFKWLSLFILVSIV